MSQKYLYFRTQATDADDDATSDSACWPTSSLIGMQPTGDSALTMFFSIDDVKSSVVLNLTTANTHLVAMTVITDNINADSGANIIVVANDDSGGTSYLANAGIASCGAIANTSSLVRSFKITDATAVEIIDINSKIQPLTSMTLANVHTGDATVQVYLRNAGGTIYYIIKDVVIPTGMTLTYM